jgi:D-alanyl-D-alanine dipeptidase
MKSFLRVFAGIVLVMASQAQARDALPPNFVFLRDIDPSIAQDIRYASSDNFTGRPLPGYGGAECVLRREVAQALAKAQADLARENLSLKVYDCYRPQRATQAMWRWAHEPETGATRRFYPALDKRTLFSGYIAAYSKHSTGTAVDLTLVRLPLAAAAPFDANARYGACSGPPAQRAPDNSIDMGSGFDCFDLKSQAIASNIPKEAAHARAHLRETMRRHGFRNYFREWWHFSYGAAPATHYDFGIPGR